MKSRLGLIAFLFVYAALTMGAEVIDRIAAVVNEEVILLSEVDEKIFLLQAQGQLTEADLPRMDEIRRGILDRLIEEKLVVQRALSQGLTVNTDEITQSVDEAISRVRAQFPDEVSFLAALTQEGITLTQLRERYENDARQERLAQRIVGREIRSQVEVKTDQVQRYFEENKSEIPARPDEVRLAHLVVAPRDKVREDAAKKLIDTARADLAVGKTFEEVVAQYGGGELGHFCEGDLAPELDDVLSVIEVGKVSEPVRTQLGWHLLQVTAREDNCFDARHVLVSVPMAEQDVTRAETAAQAARQRVVNGEAFEKVVLEVSDDDATRYDGGDLGWSPVANLLPAAAAIIDTLEVGEISPVVRSARGFHVFKLLERRKGGEYAFDEIREQLRQYLEQKQLEEAYDKWMTAVRDSAYVEIKTWTR